MRPGSTHVPLSIEMVEGGHFVVDINEAIRRAQAAIVAHVDTFHSRAAKAKATVTIKLAFQVDEVTEDADGWAGFYSVLSSVDYRPPARPTRIALAFHGEAADGEPSLFIRDSSPQGEPEQTHILNPAQAARE